MSYFPMYVELEGMPCLVAGGGLVAVRKAEVLLDFGARVRVVAPELDERLKCNPRIQAFARRFQAQDVEGMGLVVAATEKAELNHEISLLCREKRIPVNAVDQKEDCTFIFPSYVKRGQVTAAVTTGGASPALARHLKGQLEMAVPWEMGALAEAIEKIRPFVKDRLPMEGQRRQVFERLLETGLLKLNGCQDGAELGVFCQAEAERLIKEAQDADSNRNQGL